MRNRSLPLALPALLLGLTGCFDVEQGIVIEKDMSGRAHVRVTVDAEQLVGMVAALQRQLTGQEGEGEPTQEELARAREELAAKLAEENEERKAKLEQERAKIIASLPEGVTLEEFAQEIDGLHLTTRLTFSFDHVSKLAQIELPEEEPDEDAEGMPMPGAPDPSPRAMRKPFEDLLVEELEGGRVRVSFRPKNPADRPKPSTEEDEGHEGEGSEEGGAEGLAQALGDLSKLMVEALKGLKVAVRISSTTMSVAETNAMKREERGGSWELDLEKLQAMTPEERKNLRGHAEGSRLFVVFSKD